MPQQPLPPQTSHRSLNSALAREITVPPPYLTQGFDDKVTIYLVCLHCA
ncbi:hypothetical protein [Rubritalea tangerina]